MNILTRICESENIHMRVVPKDNTEMYKQIVSCGGAMAIDNLSGNKFIFLSPNQSIWERKLCTAHELAHHIFGHLKKDKISESNELEALIFSSAYLALEMFCTFQTKEKAPTSPPTKA